MISLNKIGVGNGNRTRNRRSHSPVLCQLSYSHRKISIIATAIEDVRTCCSRLEGSGYFNFAHVAGYERFCSPGRIRPGLRAPRAMKTASDQES